MSNGYPDQDDGESEFFAMPTEESYGPGGLLHPHAKGLSLEIEKRKDELGIHCFSISGEGIKVHAIIGPCEVHFEVPFDGYVDSLEAGTYWHDHFEGIRELTFMCMRWMYKSHLSYQAASKRDVEELLAEIEESIDGTND